MSFTVAVRSKTGDWYIRYRYRGGGAVAVSLCRRHRCGSIWFVADASIDQGGPGEPPTGV